VWDTGGYPAGNNYRAKVLATDGFNTGEDLSDASFSVWQPVFLPLVVR